jgi:hypothetical protein
MGGRYEIDEAAWKQIMRDGSRAVESQILVPLDEGRRTQVAVTRVGPAGERIPLEPGVIMRTRPANRTHYARRPIGRTSS